MPIAAIYARVSSDKQREESTIASQTAALIEFARSRGYQVPAEWVFEDEGYSGASLVRPGLERLRDLAAEGQIEAVLVHAPDRLSRKYAYQVLLIEELARLFRDSSDDRPSELSRNTMVSCPSMTKRPPMSFQPFALPLSSTYEQPASTGGVPQNRCRAACWRVASGPVLPRCEARCFFRHASDIGRSTSLAPCILCRYGSEHRNGGRTVPMAASLASLVGDARGCP